MVIMLHIFLEGNKSKFANVHNLWHNPTKSMENVRKDDLLFLHSPYTTNNMTKGFVGSSQLQSGYIFGKMSCKYSGLLSLSIKVLK